MTVAKRAACAAVVLASLALPGAARADAPSPGSADAIFREGRTLLDAKRYDEACPKLAESQRLEPGAGTLLALALCHEGQGKTATAWGELNEAAALGKKVGRMDLANAAQKRATAMEPQLARLVVRMPEDVDYDVKRDGEPIAKSAWGTPLPVDPGEHHVEVSAKGKVTRSYVVRLSGAGAVEIVIDKLEDKRAALPVATPSAPVSLAVMSPPVEPAQDNRGGTQRTLGLATVGVGVLGLGAGAYFGGRALSESAEGKRTCPTTPCPAAAPSDANERAKDSFKLSVISIAAGTGAITLGTILYLMAPKSAPRAASPNSRMTARIVPDASPTQVSLGVVGAF
jgi:hypothetical protein